MHFYTFIDTSKEREPKQIFLSKYLVDIRTNTLWILDIFYAFVRYMRVGKLNGVVYNNIKKIKKYRKII